MPCKCKHGAHVFAIIFGSLSYLHIKHKPLQIQAKVRWQAPQPHLALCILLGCTVVTVVLIVTHKLLRRQHSYNALKQAAVTQHLQGELVEVAGAAAASAVPATCLTSCHIRETAAEEVGDDVSDSLGGREVGAAGKSRIKQISERSGQYSICIRERL